MSRPVLAVDIDGVLNALSASPAPPGWADAFVVRSEGAEPPRVFRIRICQGQGARLLAIAAETGAELTWCTRWWWMANYLLGPLLGLPELPCVPMRASKAEALAAYAGDRPVCWLDDEPEPEPDSGWPAPWRVIAVNAASGLSDADFEAAQAWLADLGKRAA